MDKHKKRNILCLICIAIVVIYIVLMIAIPVRAALLDDKDYQEVGQVTGVTTPIQDKKPPPKLVSLGVFTVYHYCTEPYAHICGEGHGITKTGHKVQPYRTVAVDPKIVSLGSVLIIDGREYIADDVGGAIRGFEVDLAVRKHEEAIELGVIERTMFVYEQMQ